MRKLFLLAFIATAFVTKGFAQDEYQNVVKLNPLGALFGSANLAYERALSEKSSVVIAPSFGMLKSGGFKYTTFGLGAEYRFYFSKEKEAPMGFYAAPGVGFSFGQAKIDDIYGDGEDSKTNITAINAKGVIGYQWIFGSGFTVDLNGGLQYVKFKFKSDGFGIPLSGILPAVGASIGYSF